MKHIKLYEEFDSNLDEGVVQDVKDWAKKKVKDIEYRYGSQLGFLKKLFKPKWNVSYTVRVKDMDTGDVVASWRSILTIKAETSWDARTEFEKKAEEQSDKINTYEVDIIESGIKPFKGKEFKEFDVEKEIPSKIKDRQVELEKKK